MPVIDEVPYCTNHPNTPMQRIPGFLKLQHIPTDHIMVGQRAGVPLVVFYCNICGLTEQYMASIDPTWNNPSYVKMSELN